MYNTSFKYLNLSNISNERAKGLDKINEIKISKRLRGVSSCLMVFSSDAIVSLHKDTKPDLPSGIKIDLDIKDDDHDEEVSFFKGYLNNITFDESNLTLNFYDPLFTLKEKDEPEIWHNKTVDQIFQSLLDNSYEPGSTKSFKIDFSQIKVKPLIKNISNMENSSDLEFLDELSKKCGLLYFYDHSVKSEKENKLKFISPDYSKAPKGNEIILGETASEDIIFTSNMSSVPDSITVHANGKVKKEVREFKEGLSDHFKEKLNIRKKNSVGLHEHLMDQNLSPSQTQEVAEMKYQEKMYMGDSIHFSSQFHFNLGEVYKVKSSIEKDNRNLILGNYLINSVEGMYRPGYGWSFSYEGVRP